MSARRKTVVFDISGHGFGHLAQMAAVIRALPQGADLRIVVRSALRADVISGFVGDAVETAAAAPDIAMVMHGPSTVDAIASAARYRDLHADWDRHVAREADRLAALRPDLLVANVPYLSLAAAQHAGVPNVALCSINWFDMYAAYCGGQPEAPAILRAMEGAYRGAVVFLQPAPHMPMDNLPNRRHIGPLGRVGRTRRDEICAALGVGPDKRLVLATLGGIAVDKPLALPAMAGVHWLAGNGAAVGRTDVSDSDRLGISFVDVLASADAVLTKVGYSTFVEAACNGVGLISAPRADWPESAALMQWATENTNFAEAKNGLHDAQGVAGAVAKVLSARRRPPVKPSGIAEAVEHIARVAGL